MFSIIRDSDFNHQILMFFAMVLRDWIRQSFFTSKVKYGSELSMPVAFVLVNSDPEVEEELIEELIGIKGVKEVYSLYGIYDFVVKVEADSLEELKSIITWKIRRLRKVKTSSTMIVAQSRFVK